MAGSCNLIQTLLKHDLIDELRLWVFPVVIGSGKRLFGDGTVPMVFRLVDTKVSSTGVAIRHYERAGKLECGSFEVDERGALGRETVRPRGMTDYVPRRLPEGSFYMRASHSGPLGILERPGVRQSSGRSTPSVRRCGWATGDPLMMEYHDNEWGIPLHDERRLFEFLILEGAQAGLSWLTVLRKRGNYRRAFEDFDPAIVARFDSRKLRALLEDPGIVRNRLKVAAAIQNARAFLAVQEEFGSFDAHIWRFVGGRPIRNRWEDLGQIPARTAESDAMSQDLAKRGFKFVGSTICYAYMQAVGMVNDHVVSCFRYDVG